MSALNWFRYDEIRYSAGVDDYGDPLPYRGQMEVHLHKFPVTKETKCGVWIDHYGTPKFILGSARKRFACPTIEEAKASFVARKERQASILSARLEDAHEALRLATNGKYQLGAFT